MARPPTRAARLQNAAFLRELRRTGNVREAARTTGANRATLVRRRAADPGFAAEWAMALTLAAAYLAGGDEARPCDGTTVRAHGGRPQLRRRRAADLTPAARASFLAALSASANIRLSAAAAGHSHAAFYDLRRRDPGFAREWRLALAEGYATVERALLAGFQPEAAVDDAWRHNDPPAIPPMTATQALQLLHLHQKQVRFEADPFPCERRRGESLKVWHYRLALFAEQREQHERDAFRIAEAARRTARAPRSRHEPPPPALPDLAQVTGWSKADPAKRPRDPDRALFGGFRLWHLDDIEAWPWNDEGWEVGRRETRDGVPDEEA